MPSMFESTVKRLVREIGDKELRPITDILNANKVRRFSLVWTKKASSTFWQLPDVPLDVSLMDILEQSVEVPEVAVEAPYLFSDTESWKQNAGVSVNAGAEASISEGTAEYQGFSLYYKIVSTPYKTWTDLQKRKVADPEPSILEQCRRTERKLYVVTDVVELRDSCVLEDCSTGNFLGKMSLVLNTSIKVKAEGGALKVREKKLTVPEGSVMAYKRKQLVFKKNGWDILHVADDKEETFPEEMKYFSCGTCKHLISGNTVCSIEPIQRIQEPFLLDFKHLHEEVSMEARAVDQLSKDLKGVVFSNILAMLGDREALQDLSDTLEQLPLKGHLNGPGGTILNELQKESSHARNVKYPILYLLEAIMVLSDVQHRLLAPSMEKRILSQQRDLVRSILEPNFRYPWSIPFTLKPELLAPLQGEGLAITYGLLDECGLKMELCSPRSTWDLGAKKPLSALYGALCVLQQLAEA
ncbi:gasdermin-C [Sturnira hondurensis]|uniref:gasdermin-C n=1 Tax=Sturnira hondurensis TaxID=192404 RepID=UPI001879F54A|nr:gasdermin-C [Sturnira hondurensis]XP_036904437.1 gasdermin-C [Sturnira hondurensis]XP_036904438.1 gasdermin-C [Sturnira hondurensis]